MTNPTPQQFAVASRWRGFSNVHRALCAVLASLQLAVPGLVAALPSDGNVVGGQATIQQVNPNQLDIQQATDKAILNWKSFSIAADESVHFHQPSINSVALNRVVGADPSVILGQLQSNGRIFLLNPNGILFGAGAQIDVGGLLATTLQIRDEDFMAGRYLLAQDPLKGLKSVMNQGTIHVSDHGFVVLAAPGVSNEGMIVANLGKVMLGSSQALTVDLMGDGLINYALNGKVLDQVIGVDGKPLSSAVSNTGTIQADGGHVILQAKASGDIFSSVVNQSGVVRARSLENHGGVVQLLGGDETLVAATAAGAMRPAGDVSGAVVNTGTIDVAAGATNAAQGSVAMIGERVGQFGSIVATGAEGTNGGDVIIASTARTLLASGSTIDIGGIGHSSGGRLRVWSDQATFFDNGATILARGGELGGNGGFVEVSGKESLGFSGMVNALAPFGSAGSLLLDPRNITIATAGGVAYNNGVNNLFGNNVGATTTITPASINGQLANVILQANTDITVTNAIAMTNAGVGIAMQAGRSIAVNANVSTNNGNISLTANDTSALAADRAVGAGNITMAGGTTLNAGTGNLSLTIDPSAVGGFTPGTITAQTLAGGAKTITTATGTSIVNGVISGVGGLTKNGAGTLTLSGNNTYTGATTVNAGTLQLGAANRIPNASALTVAGGATFNLNNFAETIGSLSGAGNVTLGTATLTTGDATNTTYSGVMSGTGGLTKAGTGIFTLSGANTYTGATTINAGTLRVAGGAAIADTSAVTLANVAGATLDLNGTNETIGSLAGGGAAGGNVTLGAGTLTTGVATNTTYTGVISGSGGLTKQGTGIFTLSGNNTYTGATTINAGTLTLGAANRIADTSAVVVNAGTFNLNNFSETIGSLAGAGAVTLGAGVLTAGGDNSSTTYSGVMSGTGGLTKQGTGTFTLSGNNTYSGVTIVNAGTLVAAVNNALGTAAGGTTVAFGATLGFSGGINYATAEPVTLNGGTLANVAGNNTFAGPITLAANSAITVADGTTMTIGNTINGGSQLNVTSGTGGINFLSAIGGATPLSSLTATVGSISLGPVTTIGTQTYTGTTTLNGNLTTTNSAITLNSPVTLGANIILNAGAGSIAFGSTLNGAFSLVANSSGTTTFGGAVGNTMALTSLTTNAGGTTAINGGSVTTTGNQTYNDTVTMNQTTTLTSTGGAVTFGGNATNNAAGAALTVDAPTINLTGGTTIATTGNGPISFFTDTLNPNGASINVGTAAFALAPNTLTNTIEFGDVNTGRVTDVYYGSNFGSVTAGSFTIGRPAHTGNIFVTGVAAAPSPLNIVNGGTGSVTFETAPYVSGNQNFGVASGSGGIAVDSNVTIGTGTLRMTTTGAITQTAGAITADTAGLSAGTGITLAQPANNVTTLAVQTAAGNISFTDTNGFVIGNVSATLDGFHPAITGLTANSGTISLQSGGAVTQTQRILASTLSLQGGGPYALTDNTNDVNTLAANTTGAVQYTDANGLVLGASNVAGSFDVTTGGAITQSGAVMVTGTATLAAGAANDITLTNAGNNFSTVSIASGNNVALTDVNALVLGASTVSGALNVTTDGAITQSGALNVAGTTTLAAGTTNDIMLTNGGNNFSTVGIASGNNVSLTDTDALVLGASTVNGNLALMTVGTLSQSGAVTVIGTTSFTTTAANTDVLLDTQVNNFVGALSFAGTQSNFRDVQLRNVNAGATVPALTGLTNLRNLTLTFDNAPITLPALTASGNLNLTAGGSINQSGAVAVGGTTTLATTVAGSDILLDTQANDLGNAVFFGGTLGNIRDIGLRNVNTGATIPSLAGLTNLRNLTLTFDNASITLPALVLTAGGNLNATAGGSITQTGVITVPGITTLATTVAGSDILLHTQANDLGGTVAFGGTQSNIRDIGLRNVNIGATVPILAGVTNLRNLTLTFDNAPVSIPSLTATGSMNVTAGGAITQTGVVTVAGATALTAGGNDITLTNVSNNFSTVGIISGNNVAVTDNNALNISASVVGGTLDVTTGGALTQSGALNVTGTTTLASGTNDITLTDGGNNFSTVAIASGNNVALTDVNALILGASTVSGALNVTTGGAITQSGGLNVAGATTLAAGTTNDIMLTNGGNNFSAVGITSGNNIALTDANALTLNASNVSGNFSANAGDLTVGGAVTSTGGALNLTAANSVTQSANLSAAGANSVTVTAVGGSITMAAAATTTSGTGAINYTSGGNVTLGSLSTGGGVNVIANGGSVLSAIGSGTNVTAGANSTLQAFNGVVGTQANPMTVNVNPGTLGIRATTAVSGISAFLTGTVLPGNALTLLNVPPGLVCFNGCPVPPNNNPLAGLNRAIPFNIDSVVPWYLREPSDPPMISVFATYLPKSVVTETEVEIKSDEKSVSREIPPCFSESACKPAATSLTTFEEEGGASAR